MGIGQSTEHLGHTGTPEHLSHVLAERFATKCFTPLELTHFKDNFFSRAIDQGGMKYWNEKILSDFLGIPDCSDSHCPLDAGPVIFRMVSYLGAFPFQNTLAPSVLTFEAMVKVAVLLTERYGKVLRRARKDRIKLLFGSLADVGRRDVGASPVRKEADGSSGAKSRVTGFEVDAPANDDYEGEDEDDDDLALAALESLDAIDVFKHDSRIDKKVYEARISVATFRRLLILLIVIAPLKPLEPVTTYTSDLNEARMESVRKEADGILAAFSIEDSNGGISYRSFASITSNALPYLFDPLTPLFEHLLFSKNLDMTKKSGSDATVTDTIEKPLDNAPSSLSTIMLPGSFESAILKPSVLSHLSFFLPSPTSNVNLLRGNMRLHPVFSTAAHGSSLTSFSHNVLTWHAGTLLLLEGAVSESSEHGEGMVTLGAYLPQPWKSAPLSHSSTKPFDSSALPCLFELSPKHQLLQGNPSPSVQKPNAPIAYFSSSTGIAIGCQIPPPSRSQQLKPTPLGAGSLTIDASLESATFYVSSIGHNGVFLPPATTSLSEQTVRKQIDIYTMEIWGLVPEPSDASSSEPRQSAVELQRAKWEFEAREAERRRSLNLKAGAGDSAMEGARWLLETAGLIDDRHGHRGGSI
ncbi:hypothetical protein CNMCM7691_009689 [Aspergillus felis]|uniref:TLDc domain-containing protein n=1 Tax=Aspergillus felis TaxID=1287682 RepID=A0A8H6QP34_9EURO|nr:hypothetical protein CNMCM7691_009689 [Aspergillus felis]